MRGGRAAQAQTGVDHVNIGPIVTAGSNFPRSAGARIPASRVRRSAGVLIGTSDFGWPTTAFWRGWRCDVGMRAGMLRDQVCMMAQPVARALDLDDGGMVQQAVEQCSGDCGIARDFAPFREAAV